MGERVLIAELNKLQALQSSLESKNDLKIFADNPHLSEFIETLHRKSKNELEENQNEVFELVKSLEDIQRSLEDIQNIDKDELKKRMVFLQENLLNFKQKNKDSLKRLSEEEKVLEEDLKVYFNLFEKGMEYKTTTMRSKSCINFKHDNLSEEAKEFLKFVHQNNGHQNGWSLRDHTIFIQTKRKHKKQEEMVKIMQKKFPDLSEDQIIAHDKWYEQYTILLNRQKDAIKNWRLEKDINKTETIVKKEDKIKVPKSATCSFPKVDEDVKKKLARWKEMQQEKIAIKEQVKLDEIRRMKETEEKKRLKLAETKETVEKWKLAKMAQEELEKQKKEDLSKEEGYRKAQANRLIKLYQKQDLHFINKMQNALLRARKKDNNINGSFKKINELGVRDATRIFKPTKQWLSRVSSSEMRQITCPDIKKVEKLRIPEWRKLVQ